MAKQMLQETSNSKLQINEKFLPFPNNVKNRAKMTNFLKEKVHNELQSLNQKVENYKEEQESLKRKFIECHTKIIQIEKMDLVKQKEQTKENFNSLTDQIDVVNKLIALLNKSMVTEERVNLLCNEKIENLNVELIGNFKTIYEQNIFFEVTINQIQKDFEEHKKFNEDSIDAKLKKFEQTMLSEGIKTNEKVLNDFKNPLQEMSDLTNQTFEKFELKLTSLANREASSLQNLQLLNQRLKLNLLAEKQNKKKIETSIHSLLEKLAKIESDVLQNKNDINSYPSNCEYTLDRSKTVTDKDIIIKEEKQHITLPNKPYDNTSGTDKNETKTTLQSYCGNSPGKEKTILEGKTSFATTETDNTEIIRSEVETTLSIQKKQEEARAVVTLAIKNEAFEEQDLKLSATCNQESLLNRANKQIETAASRKGADPPKNITLLNVQTDHSKTVADTSFFKDKDTLDSCTKEPTQDYQGETAVASECDHILTLDMDKYANISGYKSAENHNNKSSASIIPSAVKKTVPLLLCLSAACHYFYSNYKRK